jgi:hypothetical protein
MHEWQKSAFCWLPNAKKSFEDCLRTEFYFFLRFSGNFALFAIRFSPKMLMKSTPGANVIKLFTAVIYHHSMVILSFCVIELYYPENYRGIAVNYHSILTLKK